MVTRFLNKFIGDLRLLAGRCGFINDKTVMLQLCTAAGGKLVPNHVFREIRRCGYAEQSLDTLSRLRSQFQRQPTVHGRTDNNLWPRGQSIKHHASIIVPVAERVLREVASRLPMTAIIKAQE